MITSVAITLLTNDVFNVRHVLADAEMTHTHVITFNLLSQTMTDVDMSLSCSVFVLCTMSVFYR